MTMTPERKALAAAIDAYHKASRDVEQAEDVVQRANNLLCKLAAQRAEFDTLDDEISHARADNVRRAVQGEHDLLTVEPEGFSSRIIARDKIEAELDAVRASIPTLESEVESAKRRLDECDVARDHAAEKVIAAEAETMAVEHLEKLTELRKEHYVLGYLAVQNVKRAPTESGIRVVAHLLGSGPMRRVQMPGVVIGAAMENIIGDYERKGGMVVRDAIAASVGTYWRALKDDAGAQLKIEQPPPPVTHDWEKLLPKR